jgi:outer membrane receptor protein involved in Fe transport
MACASGAHASVFGDARGSVLDPQNQPIKDARVTLRARASHFVRNTQTDASGGFLFRAVPLGEYLLCAESPGFSPLELAVTVVSDSAPEIRVPLAIAPRFESTIVVRSSPGLIGSDSPTPTALVSRADIADTPGADRSNSLAMITNFIPGAYMAHDQLHVRGGHQVTWLVDGISIPNTNIASNVGPQFDPKDIDYLEVQRGSYSAEFGDRTYGIFNVVPRTGFEYDREGEIIGTYGSFNQTNDQIRLGGHSERLAYYVSVNGNRSDFGLATPTAAVLHDVAWGLGGFSSLLYKLKDADQIRLVVGARGDSYQVPNDAVGQAAGIANAEQERDAFVNLSWVHASGRGLLVVSPFYHFNRADYLGGGTGSPVIPTDKRDSSYAGGQLVFSFLTTKHRLKAGFYGFFQRDQSFFGLRATSGSALTLQQKQADDGNLEALFLEDQWKPTSWLTWTGGVRYTHFRGSPTENDWSPRLGVSARIPHLEWTARGFWGRYYQAPPLQTVSGPILDLALEKGFGFLPLRGERDEEYQVGLAIPLAGWVIDLDYSRNAARNFFDHNALDDSSIFFPLTIDRGRIRAFEATVRSPRLWGRAQLALAYSHQYAEAQGAVTGGLTAFSPTPDQYFFLDHDQRHTLNLGVDVVLPSRAFLAGAVHYGSGFTDGLGPAHLPGQAIFDLSLGKTFGKSWSLAVHAMNVVDHQFLLDNSFTFGGTHYVDPRQVYGKVTYRFHY